MADVTIRPLTDQRSAVHQEAIDAEIQSVGFNDSPLESILFNKGVGAGSFGRIGGLTVQGGQIQGLDPIQRSAMTEYEWEPRFLTGAFGGSKNRSDYDTVATAVRTQNRQRGTVHFSVADTPFKSWNSELEANRSPEGVGDMLGEDMAIAVEEHKTKMIRDCIFGYPQDQSVGRWSAPLSLRGICDAGASTWTDPDGNTVPTADSSVYAGRDRTTFTEISSTGTTYYPLKGNLSATAVNFSFGLLDTCQYQARRHNLNLIIVNHNLFQNTIRPLARAQGLSATFVSSGSGDDIPELGLVGFMWDYVRYGRMIIIPDDHVPSGEDASSKSILMCTHTKDLLFHLDPGCFFKMPGDLQEPRQGEDDALAGNIVSRYRMFHRCPLNTVIYTNVN